ncbi:MULTISPECIES: Gp138 family membrane-puncturing spike protein [Serratia]|uniref:Gp138 family membrane-puncturing spike protein n=1 Tax=Serratia TaxID=613 RepID=UPI000453A877|nr:MULTISPECIES: Gp138 family membrane-puncturing spike protein [Serratia]EIM8479584.1 hypothetical protein [Serratia marcescens]EIU9508482.1 hypothetical protein [Serratia marcescens]ETX38714.1 hypothetical protein P805_04577 [Serratia marcescens BIDMC 44]MBH2619447.1 hypothetical protein [Serratia marcescens]MBH2781739.1 hypothetical protein [Serratia marcescens]
MIESNPLYSAMMAMKPFLMRDMMIGMPGQVLSYDPDTQRAVIECGVQRHTGSGNYRTIDPIEGVPVQFSGTAEWLLFHEMPKGTEGFIHFSQRAVDHWLNSGGPAEPFSARMFNASDAFFAPGYRSMKTVIPGLPTNGIGMSNASGDVRLHLNDGGIELKVGGERLSLSSEGLRHNGVNIGATHTHGGVETGGGNTDVPE